MKTNRFISALGLLLLMAAALFGFDTTKAPVAPDGTRAAIDAPVSIHMQNVGGTDGAGLCVPTSVTVAGRWQALPETAQFRKFTEGRPGGSYPEKLDADLKLYANRYNVKLPTYVQHTGGDEAFLDLCIATRRMPGITYAGLDGWYDSGIAHMVNLAHLDATRGGIIDNNRAGSFVWGQRKQITNRWKGLDDNGRPILVPVSKTRWVPVGGGWAFVWLTPPPPPKSPTVKTEDGPAAEFNGPVWEREILDGRPFWFVYIQGEPKWCIDADKKWHRMTGPESWEREEIDPPAGLAAPDEPEPTDDWNSGIDVAKVGNTHRYWINGRECSRAKAFAAVADPTGLVDDSDRYHLTVVANQALTADAKAVIAKYERRLHVLVIAPDSWVAKDRVVADVQLQEPAKVGGKVVGTAAEHDAASLARILGDVFDVPPPVTPLAPVVPAPTPDQPAPVPAPPNVPQGLWAALLALLAFFIFRR